ncbi:GNAT family N-acetyltransferase, partial [Myxococcota bacterium]|nr:GNAT family N-acetyltransferase [Myxococcota bacterium]
MAVADGRNGEQSGDPDAERGSDGAQVLAQFQETRGHYRVRFAASPDDRLCVQRLRYEVFARELGASLHGAERELDLDPLDELVDHLLVIDAGNDECVGTYRLATRERVGADPGFYTRRQFEMAHLDPRIESEGVELGRA